MKKYYYLKFDIDVVWWFNAIIVDVDKLFILSNIELAGVWRFDIFKLEYVDSELTLLFKFDVVFEYEFPGIVI